MSRRGHNYAPFPRRMASIGDLKNTRGGMRGVSNRTTGRVLACLALLGGAGIGGLAAGWTASAGRVADHATTIRVAEMAPADIVNLRFPADWGEASAAA